MSLRRVALLATALAAHALAGTAGFSEPGGPRRGARKPPFKAASAPAQPAQQRRREAAVL